MKKIAISASALLLITAVAGALALKSEPQISENSSQPELLRATTLDRPKYIMQEYEGNIAIFNEDKTLYKLYEVNVSLLPEYDQKLLKNGIQIVGDDELRARIEDYTS